LPGSSTSSSAPNTLPKVFPRVVAMKNPTPKTTISRPPLSRWERRTRKRPSGHRSPTRLRRASPYQVKFSPGRIGRARLRRAATPFVAKALLIGALRVTCRAVALAKADPRLSSFLFLSFGISLGFGFWDFERLRFSDVAHRNMQSQLTLGTRGSPLQGTPRDTVTLFADRPRGWKV
jgi:hypothetical protein